MAILFGAALFFGITTALCVPYFYAYCKQTSNVTVQGMQENSSQTKDEDDDVNMQDIQSHSVEVKGEENNSLTKGKIEAMKDVMVNTIESMASDATSYKKLASIRGNHKEKGKEMVYSTSTQTSSNSIHLDDSSSSPTNNRGPLKVQAVVHARNPVPEISDNFGESNLQNSINGTNNNESVRKRQFFKKEKPSDRLKRIFTKIKSRGFPKLVSEETQKVNVSLSTIHSEDPEDQEVDSHARTISRGACSSTLIYQSQSSPIGHSKLQNSRSKLAFKLHEVNGSPSIQIESPNRGNTSLLISVTNISSSGQLSTIESHNKSYLVVIEETPCSSDQETHFFEKFSLNRLYDTLPGRFRKIENDLDVKKASTI